MPRDSAAPSTSWKSERRSGTSARRSRAHDVAVTNSRAVLLGAVAMSAIAVPTTQEIRTVTRARQQNIRQNPSMSGQAGDLPFVMVQK